MVEQFTQGLIQWIQALPAGGIYATFFLIAYCENIIPPIPGDLLVAFGGYLAAEAIILLLPVFGLTVVASVAGFMTVYWLGSHWGLQIKQRPKQFWMVRFISIEYIEKTQQWMGRWGLGVVVANRFLAGTRSVISLAAGMSHTDVFKTIVASFISSLLWNAILLGFGWFVHNKWEIIGHYLSIYGQIIIGIVLCVIIIRVGIHYYSKRANIQKHETTSDN